MKGARCSCRFKKGDLVRVRAENARVRWRKPHLRTPGYIYGLVGEVERDCQVCFLHHLTALPAEVDGELDTFECSPTFFSNTPGLLRADKQRWHCKDLSCLQYAARKIAEMAFVMRC